MMTWSSNYQNNRGQYHTETLRSPYDQKNTLDEIKITTTKKDGSHEFFANSELGFMMMLVEHANKDPKFKDSLFRVAAELGSGSSDDTLLNALTQANKTVKDQQALIDTLKPALVKAYQTLSDLDIMRGGATIPLVKHLKEMPLIQQVTEIRNALNVANGPPPGSTGAWA